MALHVMAVRMIDGGRWQHTGHDNLPALGADDIHVSAEMGAPLALPEAGNPAVVYFVVADERCHIRVGRHAGELATTAHWPLPQGCVITFRAGPGATHISAVAAA